MISDLFPDFDCVDYEEFIEGEDIDPDSDESQGIGCRIIDLCDADDVDEYLYNNDIIKDIKESLGIPTEFSYDE